MLLNSLDSFERMWKITVYCQTLFLILSQLTTHSQFCWKQELKTTWLVKEFVMELLATRLTPTVWISPFDDLYHRRHHHCDHHHPQGGWDVCLSIDREKRVTLKGKVGTQKTSPSLTVAEDTFSMHFHFRKVSKWIWFI